MIPFTFIIPHEYILRKNFTGRGTKDPEDVTHYNLWFFVRNSYSMCEVMLGIA